MSTPKATAKQSVDKTESASDTEKTEKADVGTPPLDLVNPGTTSLSYDLVGHQIDAGGRVTVPSVDKVGQKLVRRSFLLCQDSNDTWITFDNSGTPVARPVADGASQPK